MSEGAQCVVDMSVWSIIYFYFQWSHLCGEPDWHLHLKGFQILQRLDTGDPLWGYTLWIIRRRNSTCTSATCTCQENFLLYPPMKEKVSFTQMYKKFSPHIVSFFYLSSVLVLCLHTAEFTHMSISFYILLKKFNIYMSKSMITRFSRESLFYSSNRCWFFLLVFLWKLILFQYFSESLFGSSN